MAPDEDIENGEAKPEGKKNRWGLTLGLLLLFLAGGGFYALNSMRAAAHKLAESANNGPLADDSSVYTGKAAARSADVFAADAPAPAEKPAGSALNPKLKPGWVREMAAEQEAAARGASAATVPAAGREEDQQKQQQRAAGGAAAPRTGSSMGARLQARGGFGGRFGAMPSKGASTAQVGDFQANGAAVGKPSFQRQTTQAGAPKKGGGGGVMDVLKGAFRASFYGARIASEDSAKNWIAKTFDATPDAATTLEYDEKVRTKLDVVNPNSIPKFLREQDVSAAEAKTLTPSDVSTPKGDSEGTQEALKEDTNYQKKKAMGMLGDGMLNGLFSGIGGGSGSSTDKDAAAGDTKDGTDRAGSGGSTYSVSPNDISWDVDPSLWSTDEFGNTTVPGANGMSYIFGKDGGILGCESAGANMCLMAGADGCSSDLTLSSFSGE